MFDSLSTCLAQSARNDMTDMDQRRITQIREEMHQLIEELESLTGASNPDVAAAPSAPRPPPIGAAVFLPSPAMRSDPICPESDGLESVARQLLKQAALREAFYHPSLFADPAWNMLLALFISTAEGKSVSVSSLCIASRVPSTTALRWIRTLEEQTLLKRARDPHDQRRSNIGLTINGFSFMKNYLLCIRGVQDPAGTPARSPASVHHHRQQ